MKIIFNEEKNEWKGIYYVNLKKSHQMADYYRFAHQLNLFCFIILW